MQQLKKLQSASPSYFESIFTPRPKAEELQANIGPTGSVFPKILGRRGRPHQVDKMYLRNLRFRCRPQTNKVGVVCSGEVISNVLPLNANANSTTHNAP